jgi:hypothetical protein
VLGRAYIDLVCAWYGIYIPGVCLGKACIDLGCVCIYQGCAWDESYVIIVTNYHHMYGGKCNKYPKLTYPMTLKIIVTP